MHFLQCQTAFASLLALAVARPVRIPDQFLYNSVNANSATNSGGCNITGWKGTDELGMAGYPSLTKIECAQGKRYAVDGIAESAFQIWLVEGKLRFNGESVQMMGSSFWANAGTAVSMSVSGMAWVVGDVQETMLVADKPVNVFTSSYDAPETRKYDLQDAKKGFGNASLGHDEHICNGTTPSMDFVFGTRSQVDPPVVTVLNCANGSTPETNYVWSHFHPFGALYIPFSGDICFSTDVTRCISPGEARWTSSLLQYYEWFKKPDAASASAEAVRQLAEVEAEACERPIVFAVTNFDITSAAGVPNFADWPREAHGQESCVGLGPWGVFDAMTIRSTTVVTKTVMIDSSRGSLASHTPVDRGFANPVLV